MNKSTHAGYVGKDAELKFMPDGKPVCNFSIAVSEGTKEKPKTTWIDCAMWGDRAEKVAQYITKGSFIVVDGQPGCRAWIGKDGAVASTLTCRVDKLTFGGGKTQSAPADESPHAAAPVSTPPATHRNTVSAFHEKMAETSSAASPPDNFDDDIPF